MRHALHTAIILAVAPFLASPHIVLAENAPSNPAAGDFVYKPPLRGAPSRRIGGATRGSGDSKFVLNVLAPDQTGYTTQAQPRLYWYSSGPSTTSIEVTVIAEVAEQPLISKNLATSPGGMQSIDLAKYGISLKPDTEYEWFVSAVPDADQRSKDITSGGTLLRVSPDPAVAAQINAAGERELPGIYAAAGFWYDAIDTLSRLIERNPDDATLRAQRAALLKQIDLPNAAAYDLSPPR